MSEQERKTVEEQAEQEETIRDLDVPEDQRGDVAGGFSKVRVEYKEQEGLP